MLIEFNPSRVANLLKAIINSHCEEGFVWYPNVGEMPSPFEVNYAIEILEKEESGFMEIVDEEGENG